jgi:subtilisin family serine protease
VKPTRLALVGASALGALVVCASVVVASGAAADPAARVSFERITGLHNYGGIKPGLLDPDRQVKVIVELAGDSVGESNAAAGGGLSEAEQTSLRSQLKARQSGVEAKVHQLGGQVLATYQSAYNGVAARVAVKDLGSLTATAGVSAVHPVRTYELENVKGVPYVEAPAAWDDLGLTGDGIKVAVIDTGVDYYHANFAGTGDPDDFANDDTTVIEPGTFPTAKVIDGFDFVGNAYDASSDDPAATVPHPDPDPQDCFGHGSHVAGSSSGTGVLGDGSTFSGPYNAATLTSNTFRIGPGTAPESSILAYRVFGCDGSADEAVIVAALERALVDGADVVNMSLGSDFGRETEPSAVATNTLSENGVVVVASAGNAGPNAYIVGSPSIASRALSVAALDASGATFPGGSLTGGTIGAPITMINANNGPLPVTGPLKVLKNPDGSVALGCDAADYASSTGKIVVTMRGVCARVDRAIHGDAAGAVAVIMINNAAGLPPFEGPINGVDIPFLGAATSATAALVANDGAVVTIAPTTVANPGFQRAATFSSGGPRGDSAFKPEVAAPGVSIASTGMGTGNASATMSGTSMSSPHTAGVAALVKEAHPSWSPEHVKASIVNTANAGSKILAYNPRVAGSGVVDARRATDTLGLATANDGLGSLFYGYEPLGGAYNEMQTLHLTNTGTGSITYNLAAAFVGSNLGIDATFSPGSMVTVPAGGSMDVTVTFALTAAEVAALPSAETSNFGALVTARGAVVATPTTSGAGVYPLRVPFIVVPRGLSNVTAKIDKLVVPGPIFTSRIALANTGIHSGNADVYQWGIEDRADAPAFEGSGDIRAIGVQSLPGELFGVPGDTALVFAVNMHGRWSNPSTIDAEIPIDTNRDGELDFIVVGFDLGAILAGAFNGQYASFIFDADGNLVDAWVAIAPMNGSTMLLPALAGTDLGLTGDGLFRYSGVTFSVYDGSFLDETHEARYAAYSSAVETGGFFTVPPGSAGTVNLRFHPGRILRQPALGWMIVTTDDANGAAQADLLGLSTPIFKFP